MPTARQAVSPPTVSSPYAGPVIARSAPLDRIDAAKPTRLSGVG